MSSSNKRSKWPVPPLSTHLPVASIPLIRRCDMATMDMYTASSPSQSSAVKVRSAAAVSSLRRSRKGHASFKRLELRMQVTCTRRGSACVRCSRWCGQLQHIPMSCAFHCGQDMSVCCRHPDPQLLVLTSLYHTLHTCFVLGVRYMSRFSLFFFLFFPVATGPGPPSTSVVN